MKIMDLNAYLSKLGNTSDPTPSCLSQSHPSSFELLSVLQVAAEVGNRHQPFLNFISK
jgi:hypothetical protein